MRYWEQWNEIYYDNYYREFICMFFSCCFHTVHCSWSISIRVVRGIVSVLFLFWLSLFMNCSLLHKGKWAILSELNATKEIINLFFFFFCWRINSNYIRNYLTWVSEISIRHSTMRNSDKWCEASLWHTFIMASIILSNYLLVLDWFHCW